MPIFEFQCQSCEEIKEKIMSYDESEKAEFTCPKCEKTMRKIQSEFGMKFNGKFFKNTGGY